MKKTITIASFIFFSLSFLMGHSQSPPIPDLRCVSIDNNLVTLTWNAYYDTLLIETYHTYRSYDGVIFYKTDNDQISGDALSFTYQEDSTGALKIYYFIQLVDNDSGYSAPSDTLCSIFLNVSGNSSHSIATLNWNALSPKHFCTYDIFRKDESSNWEWIGSTDELIYKDTITYPYCSETLLQYKVECIDTVIYCISASNVDSDWLHDGFPPGNNISIVQMDTVSVAFDGNVAISWDPVQGSDLKEYIIYRKDATGGWPPIDQVAAPGTFYIDYTSNAQYQIETYRVAAVDLCNLTGLGGFDTAFFNTMYLNPLYFDYCDTSIVLSWNPYINFNPVDGYKIYEIDTSTMETNLITKTLNTSYTYTSNFIPDSTYCYYIRASDNNSRTSSSCIQCFFSNRPDQPDTLNLKIASVDTLTNDAIWLQYFVDTTAFGTQCIILRKTNANDPYDTIHKEDINSSSFLSFTDYNVQPSSDDYYYKIIVLDDCNNETWLPLNEARTILLQGYVSAVNINTLQWTPYETTTGDISQYRLYRKINGLIDTIINFDPDELQYDDNISHLSARGGRFTYLVEAVILSFSFPSNDTLKSFSNETLISQISNIHMPNAFTPNNDGYNDSFGPVNIFTDQSADYLFVIYNRWGEKVFETSEINNSWDGQYKNQPSPLGVYVYLIHYISPEGLKFEKKGTVTLLK